MRRRSNWRELKEWKKSGLPFSTVSDEASKLYDAALTQYVGQYNDETYGGLKGTLYKLLEADPSAIMGHVISLDLQLFLSSKMPNDSPEIRNQLNILIKLRDDSKVTDWEKRHVKAVELLADGYINNACLIWQDILVDYPLDMLALRLSIDGYLHLGTMWEIRYTMASVIPHWSPDIPLCNYLHGFYSLCLVETYSFGKAEKEGKKGLELDPTDIMAAHSMAHVYEMEGRYDEGIKFMQKTVKNWEHQDILACHNFWHWAVFLIDKADYEGALALFDNQVYPRAVKSPTPLNIADSSALLKRLEMEGVSLGSRWQGVNKLCRIQTAEKNNFIFFEVHYMIAGVGAKQKADCNKIMDQVKELLEDSRNSCNKIAKREIGVKIYEALMAYGDGKYAKVVDTLYPARNKIYLMAGSIPQRDIIYQLLIHAAIQSTEARHKRLARFLLDERKAEMETSQLTDRLIQKATAGK